MVWPVNRVRPEQVAAITMAIWKAYLTEIKESQ